MTVPPTQPEPRLIAIASHALACVLETPTHPDGGAGLDVEARLTVAEALRILTDVHPPYPPITEPLVPMGPAEGVDRARNALTTVLAVSTDIGDVIRAARAVQVLHAIPNPERSARPAPPSTHRTPGIPPTTPPSTPPVAP